MHVRPLWSVKPIISGAAPLAVHTSVRRISVRELGEISRFEVCGISFANRDNLNFDALIQKLHIRGVGLVLSSRVRLEPRVGAQVVIKVSDYSDPTLIPASSLCEKELRCSDLFKTRCNRFWWSAAGIFLTQNAHALFSRAWYDTLRALKMGFLRRYGGSFEGPYLRRYLRNPKTRGGVCYLRRYNFTPLNALYCLAPSETDPVVKGM